MEREILFRGQDKNGKWHFGDLVHDAFDGTSKNIEVGIREKVNGHYCYPVEIIAETIGQFTGLTDKNGVKIFEGDKLRFEDDQESIVKWMQGGLTIEADFGDYDLTTVGWAIDILGNCEVISTTHDNPELIIP